MVGSCGGTDSGTYASPPSYPVFPLSLNVVNECCMKSLRPASCWRWTQQSVLRAPTTTTTTTQFCNSAFNCVLYLECNLSQEKNAMKTFIPVVPETKTANIGNLLYIYYKNLPTLSVPIFGG